MGDCGICLPPHVEGRGSNPSPPNRNLPLAARLAACAHRLNDLIQPEHRLDRQHQFAPWPPAPPLRPASPRSARARRFGFAPQKPRTVIPRNSNCAAVIESGRGVIAPKLTSSAPSAATSSNCAGPLAAQRIQRPDDRRPTRQRPRPAPASPRSAVETTLADPQRLQLLHRRVAPHQAHHIDALLGPEARHQLAHQRHCRHSASIQSPAFTLRSARIILASAASRSIGRPSRR